MELAAVDNKIAVKAAALLTRFPKYSTVIIWDCGRGGGQDRALARHLSTQVKRKITVKTKEPGLTKQYGTMTLEV